MRIRTYKKPHLPEEIEYNGKKLTLSAGASAHDDKSILSVAQAMKAENKTVCLVEVMHKNLRGKTDLHGKPYTPNTFIFSN